jgi:hypothetical protein
MKERKGTFADFASAGRRGRPFPAVAYRRSSVFIGG